MVDKPQVNPQNVRRASGQEVPTLRNVQAPNLRGIGRVQPTAARAEQQAAAQTAAVIESVGNSVMRTAEGIQARADARKREEEKLKKREEDAVIEAMTEHNLVSNIATIDSRITERLDEIVLEGGTPEEINSKFAAFVNGITSELDENSSNALRLMSDVKAKSKLMKYSSSFAQAEFDKASSELDAAIDSNTDIAVSTAGLNSQDEMTAHETALISAFGYIDSSSRTPTEKLLLKNEILGKVRSEASRQVVFSSDNPVKAALDAYRGVSKNKDLNDLPFEMREELLAQAVTAENAELQQANEDRRKLEEFKANYSTDALVNIELETDPVKKSAMIDDLLKDVRDNDLGSGVANSAIAARNRFSKARDEKLNDAADTIDKTIEIMRAKGLLTPEMEKQFILSKGEVLKPEQLRRQLEESSKAAYDVFSSESWKTFIDEVDLAFPDAMPADVQRLFLNETEERQNLIRAAYGKADTEQQSVLVEARKVVQEEGLRGEEAVKRANEILARRVNAFNQTTRLSRVYVKDVGPPSNITQDEVVKFGRLKKDFQSVLKAQKFVNLDGTVDKEAFQKEAITMSEDEMKNISLLLRAVEEHSYGRK